MTQDQCLQTPSHFTYLGICYPGNNLVINLTSADHPTPVTAFVQTTPTQPTTVSVPEPSMLALLALGFSVPLLQAMRRRRRIRAQ